MIEQFAIFYNAPTPQYCIEKRLCTRIIWSLLSPSNKGIICKSTLITIQTLLPNINIFVSFCERVFKEYSSKVDYWCTINEPAVVATQGYFSGRFPPGKKDSDLSAVVLKNFLDQRLLGWRGLHQPGSASPRYWPSRCHPVSKN